MNVPVLETKRLLLKPLSSAVAEQMQHLFPQWDIVRYLGSHIPWPYPEEGARDYIENIAIPAMNKGNSWNWGIYRKEAPDTFIGEIVVRISETENRGFWLDPQWRRNGYMSEACKAVTYFWFTTLEQPHLTITKAVENEGSRRISINEGMHWVSTEEMSLVGGTLPVERWEISREAWLAHNIGT
ncbi:hypothetical protein LMG33818_001161 [Halomonadaceae bacterium LMG 33818]|uniref:GNAT family N-acetyltransferase n=1 Tax=Cernens ardua TaxID=3402176 RepID=UPI003EDB8662